MFNCYFILCKLAKNELWYGVGSLKEYQSLHRMQGREFESQTFLRKLGNKITVLAQKNGRC